MKKRENVTSGIKELASEVREGDGVDPREEAKRKLHQARKVLLEGGSHQQERLATQIATAVDFALNSATTPILNALTVHKVIPQRSALVVVIVPRDPTVAVNLAEAVAEVNKSTAMLRCEVAAAITRKDAPNLRFLVLPAGSDEIGAEQ